MSLTTTTFNSTPPAPVDDLGTTHAAPAAGSKERDARESAAGCRERASADLLRALEMATVNGRQVFEKSAASWTKRADMLQRIETGIEARLAAPPFVELTSDEMAEDLACKPL
jgi:hypothetical protein